LRTAARPRIRGEDLLETVEEIYEELEGAWSETLGGRGVASMRCDLRRALEASYGGKLPAIRPSW